MCGCKSSFTRAGTQICLSAVWGGGSLLVDSSCSARPMQATQRCARQANQAALPVSQLHFGANNGGGGGRRQPPPPPRVTTAAPSTSASTVLLLQTAFVPLDAGLLLWRGRRGPGCRRGRGRGCGSRGVLALRHLEILTEIPQTSEERSGVQCAPGFAKVPRQILEQL